MARLTVVIPSTDRRATLERVLSAISRASEPPEEVIVVDEPAGMGPAAARNRGARQSSGDVVVFVDADVEVHEDAFRRIRAAFAGDRSLDAVFGAYDDRPDGGVVSDFRNLLHHHVHSESAGPVSSFWAGLGAIRRAVFADVGGFDEDRFPRSSIEDIELGMRLAAHRKRVVLDPNIQGTHLKRWTLVGMLKTDFLRRGVPWVGLLLENRSPSTALNLGWRHRASAATSVVLVTALLARRPAVAGVSVAVMVCLNRRFYVLLARHGWRHSAVAVPLHVVHHLVAVAAVPAALALRVRSLLAPAANAP